MFKKLLIVTVSAIVLSGCLTTNQQGGTLIGATTGGLLGSQFGKGDGRLVTTALGVLIGATAGNAVGQHMDQPPTIVYRETARATAPRSNNRRLNNRRSNNQCSYIQNEGVRSSCERGLADRNRQIQKEAEQRAYQCSRYGRCY
mgnify:CR=1 FL=1